MREFYRNEKDKDDPDWGGGGGGGGGGSGGYIISGWGGGDGEDPVSPVVPVGQITPDVSLLRCSASGRLMVDNTGMLITCQQLCKAPPAMLIYLKEHERVDRHASCIQCNLIYTQLNPLLNYPEKTLTYELWPRDHFVDADYEEKPMYQGTFPLPDPGERLTVNIKWQNGHWDIAEFSEMKIVLFGYSTGWNSFSLKSWRKVADITVDQYRHIFVNNISAKLQGNKI